MAASNIPEYVTPYVQYGLDEAQRLYQTGGAQYYPGQTYVSPSQATQQGVSAFQNRALQGNPLMGAAQSQMDSTIGGQYLGGNPFFQGAFAPAAREATYQFNQAIGNIDSAASKAGRYGSGAMGSLQDRAAGQFAQQLTDTAGKLAYQNYGDERTRQQAAMMGAPAMAQADYQDIENLIKAGQVQEQYAAQELQSDMDRFNFLQGAPQRNLANYLSSVYASPAREVQPNTTTQPAPSSSQNALGWLSALGALYKMSR
jgi:hypothetical protein